MLFFTKIYLIIITNIAKLTTNFLEITQSRYLINLQIDCKFKIIKIIRARHLAIIATIKIRNRIDYSYFRQMLI